MCLEPNAKLFRVEVLSVTGIRRIIGVIDDDPSVDKALHRLFRTAGYDVSLFTSAEKYLANSGRGNVGCLVIDARLPGMSGLELQEQLQAEGGLPIVLITAHED